MKKILLILLILMIGFGGYVLYDHLKVKGIPILETEEETINIDSLYIYGNHLNMHGSLASDDNYELVFYNGEFIAYDIIIDDDNNEFILGDKINEGITLEDIPRGKYYLFLRSTHKDEKDNNIYKYYILNNQTEYKETEYYTFSNVDNKIVINSDNDYKTLMAVVNENTNDTVYDVIVDPGHGGMDSGASKNGQRESTYTMKIALDLKQKLEEKGLKVKLTREDGQLNDNEVLQNYGENGRVAVAYKNKAKYLFSIHLNSNSYGSISGLEVYTPARINYDFAKFLANNIITNANTKYSKNTINQIYDGIYTRTWTQEEIDKSAKEYQDKGMLPYDITTKTNYYFIIRETGGIVTGAYVDNRNEDIEGNPYIKSNVGTETYLLELGYLTSSEDMDNISNNMEKYTEAITNSFMTIFSAVDSKNQDNGS